MDSTVETLLVIGKPKANRLYGLFLVFIVSRINAFDVTTLTGGCNHVLTTASTTIRTITMHTRDVHAVYYSIPGAGNYANVVSTSHI